MGEKNKLKKLRNRLIAVYTVLGILLLSAGAASIISAAKRLLDKQAESFTSSLTAQLKKSVDNYIVRIEKSSAAVFENEEDISYCPAENGEKSIEDIKKEEQLTNKLISFSLMENYCDFGIIYRNGGSAGRISDGTTDLFGSDIFETFCSYLDDGSDSKWIAENNSRFSRLYYIKKLNAGALLLTSVYTTELDTVFQKFGPDSDTVAYLTDKNGNILYSSDNAPEKTGEALPKDISGLIQDRENIVFSDRSLTGAATVCEPDWTVVTCVRSKGLFSGNSDLATLMITVFSAAAAVLISAGFIASGKFASETEKGKASYENEEIDTVTGLLNGMSLEEEISDRIETCLMGSTYAFILIKIKDFEDIKLRLGCNYANDALRKMGDMISASFGAKDIVGINENSEFTVFADFSDFDLFKAHNSLKARCNSLCSSFKSFCAGGSQEHKLYAAMGVCVYPDSGKTFDELYENASAALELSLRADKDSCIFYEAMSKRQ